MDTCTNCNKQFRTYSIDTSTDILATVSTVCKKCRKKLFPEKKITKASIARAEKKALKEADKKFALDVKARDNFMCVICSDSRNLHTHHILPRERRDIRHNLLNGITLCCLHHKFSLLVSPHKNAFEFFVWLAEHRPEQFYFCKMNVQRDYRGGING